MGESVSDRSVHDLPAESIGYQDPVDVSATPDRAGEPNAVVILGSLRGILGNAAKARAKMVTFERLHQLYPEYGAVLFGDNGQGDVPFEDRAIAVEGSPIRGAFSPARRCDGWLMPLGGTWRSSTSPAMTSEMPERPSRPASSSGWPGLAPEAHASVAVSEA